MDDLNLSPRHFIATAFIATALYGHGTLTPRRFIATALYRHGTLSPRHFIATALYRHGVAQGALTFAIP
jgi:hypothetical protein